MSLKTFDSLQAVLNRAAQTLQEVQDLDGDLKLLDSDVYDLVTAAKAYVPPSQAYLRTVDPTAPTGDPREELSVLRGRLRQALQNLDSATQILATRRGEIEKLLG
jgi:ABC-type transporter Mla subunit MlaD